MIQNCLWPAMLGAALLAGCAGAPSAARKPVLVLADPVDNAPRDPGCDALDQRALERGSQNAFKLIGNEMTVHRASATFKDPQHPPSIKVPLGTHRVGLMARQPDGTFHSLFVDCETRLAYISKRGGVIDVTYWFGPFNL